MRDLTIILLTAEIADDAEKHLGMAAGLRLLASPCSTTDFEAAVGATT
jgi:hypothetical protein